MGGEEAITGEKPDGLVERKRTLFDEMKRGDSEG
jgi:hypothetical protein